MAILILEDELVDTNYILKVTVPKLVSDSNRMYKYFKVTFLSGKIKLIESETLMEGSPFKPYMSKDYIFSKNDENYNLEKFSSYDEAFNWLKAQEFYKKRVKSFDETFQKFFDLWSNSQKEIPTFNFKE